MSLKSFLNKIWSAIRSLFNSFPADLKIAVHAGVVITENIKNFMDSPLADVLAAVIPGTVDDKLKEILRAGIPQILADLKLADECTGQTDPQEITKCAIRVLQNLDGDIKSAFLHNLSVLITQLAADGELSWSDGVCIVEWYYQHQFKVAE
ncbi:hypothetical protein [Mucilaginibacter segetis]|uniref:Uncharacterized protein n=1 Tax=Mucilaginibacter segetis TaxID=2793071 RepID=A0A934UM72_9SPHI|nr:hypothetical protein [Mucilaginibacter segetis]MBK0378577.1 hypothetical protein [Mucilaginibacter segetis]